MLFHLSFFNKNFFLCESSHFNKYNFVFFITFIQFNFLFSTIKSWKPVYFRQILTLCRFADILFLILHFRSTDGWVLFLGFANNFSTFSTFGLADFTERNACTAFCTGLLMLESKYKILSIAFADIFPFAAVQAQNKIWKNNVPYVNERANTSPLLAQKREW